MSGPGGVGKGTLVARLRERRPDLVVSVSATTRAPRRGEVDGRDYHFLSDQQFSDLADAGGFLEWEEFAGHRYGTPWSSIAHAVAHDTTVLLEIDVKGALQVRRRRPDATLVFVVPPTSAGRPGADVLRERLSQRSADTPQQVRQRLAIAERELEQAAQFDHVVVNDDLETAVDELDRIVGR